MNFSFSLLDTLNQLYKAILLGADTYIVNQSKKEIGMRI